MKATGPGQPAQLLLAIIEILSKSEIPYVVIGAFAVSFYGVPRSTNDADAAIFLRGTGKSAKVLTRELTASGYETELKMGDADDPIAGVIVVNDRHGNRADLIVGVRGMDAGAAVRAVTTSLLGRSVKIASAEDLIAMKVAAGGVQDREDVRGILDVSWKALDLNLLRRLARRYGSQVEQNVMVLLSQSPHQSE